MADERTPAVVDGKHGVMIGLGLNSSVQHVTLGTTLAKPPSPVRIRPLMETDNRGKRSPAGWAVVADGQVFAFPAEVSRAEVAAWLLRHGYRLAFKIEWRRA